MTQESSGRCWRVPLKRPPGAPPILRRGRKKRCQRGLKRRGGGLGNRGPSRLAWQSPSPRLVSSAQSSFHKRLAFDGLRKQDFRIMGRISITYEGVLFPPGAAPRAPEGRERSSSKPRQEGGTSAVRHGGRKTSLGGARQDGRLSKTGGLMARRGARKKTRRRPKPRAFRGSGRDSCR